ncbi:MAG: apolipoprotein N-acyltransferase [Robiginitomaculum sp.]
MDALPVSFFANFFVKRKFTGWLISFALGGLAILGQAPFHIWPITILCFALFMVRLESVRGLEKPNKSAFWQGFGFGLGYCLFGLYWIGSAFIVRGSEFILIMPFAILGFCAGLALFWAIAAWAYLKLSVPGHALRAVSFSGAFFITEFARARVLSGFPWNLPGTVFEAGKPMSQIASIVGVSGLSALVLFSAGALALLLQGKNRKFIPATTSALVLAVVYVFGALRLSNAVIEYVPNIKLRIVHANISQRDKLDPNKYVETINHYLRLTTSEGFDEITHVIWPEGTVPGLMLKDKNLMQAIENIFVSQGGEQPPVFIIQTLRSEMQAGRSKPNYYNSALAITYAKDRPAQLSSFYDKQKLVPFGEYIPGHGALKKLGFKTLSSALESMTPGTTGNTPIINGLPPVSLQICYEINFTNLTSEILKASGEEPQWILNLSNDAWYGQSSGPYQQANQARYRAIETGLPLVRSTSGGISTITDAYGRVLMSLSLKDDSVLDASLPRHVQKTAYNNNVNYIILLLIGLMQLGCYLFMQRRR